MIYCDHNATTPLREEVLEAMLPFLREEMGNPSSAHQPGHRARCAVEEARRQVASALGAKAAEIVFTSGGTEANNQAILHAVPAAEGRRVIAPPIEHPSVLAPLDDLRERGATVEFLEVDRKGRVDPPALAALLAEPADLVTIAWANNEIGTIQPIDEIGELCRERGVPLHVDAVQAFGKIPVDARAVDSLSLSAHKLGASKGCGVLYQRGGGPVRPLLRGGNQERGRRAGTENVAAIVGFGVAAEKAVGELTSYAETYAALRDALWTELKKIDPGLLRNGAWESCLPNTLHVRFSRVEGDAMVAALDGDEIAVSSGSACAAGGSEASHVLLALGLTAAEASRGVRFSFGRGNDRADVTKIAAAVAATLDRLGEIEESRARASAG